MVNLLSVPASPGRMDELNDGYDLLRCHLLEADKVLNRLKDELSDLKTSELHEQLVGVREKIEAAKKQNTVLQERLMHFLTLTESHQAAEEGAV